MKPISATRIVQIFSIVFLLASCASDNLEPGPGGYTVFPADNIWNTPVDDLPVDANSDAYIATIGSSTALRADFGAVPLESAIGIPFIAVDSSQPEIPIVYTDYADESDPGPFPIPLDAPIQGGPDSDGDRHVLVIDTDAHMLYELYNAFPKESSWEASCGAKFDLSSNALRPEGYTSADAAGLPIFPGLVRYEEVKAGEINHALRFFVSDPRQAHVWPARFHPTGYAGSEYPPMGQRFRLKADYNISGFSAENQVILKALKKYGMMIADKGSDLFLPGVPDERWDNEDLLELMQVKAVDFEAVDVSSLMVDPDSGQVNH